MIRLLDGQRRGPLLPASLHAEQHHVDLIRTRRLKWGVPVMLLAAPYLGIAAWCTALIESGGPGWLHLVVLVCIWNALKMVVIGPVSVVLLVRARAKERLARKRAERAVDAEVSQRELTRSSR